ncbi:14997_t:CDS:2 [Cetraspora pellucida]|uniref:14997_t:CDS:1 n=1 Tax=Cetraspora pellucida TaxID=1433469 RepID=A0A9N9IZJ4_9GLOM|nr:14997_t:CDS:2 [Cetraspora pellucida]
MATQKPIVDSSRRITSDQTLDFLHKLKIDALISETRKPIEPLVYARTTDKVSLILNLLRIHDIISLPIYDPSKGKFIAIVNVVHIVRFLMLRKVYSFPVLTNESVDGESQTKELGEKIKSDLIDVYDLQITEVINSIEPKALASFKIYHKSAPLIVGLQAMGTRENVYSILASMAKEKENIEDIQKAMILTQWDAINFLLNNEVFKQNKTFDLPASKAMQRNWISFTMKDDPNQPSHRLPVTSAKMTFAFSITQDMSAFAGFKIMAIHRLSSIAIVDINNTLVDNLSASDIRYLTIDNITDGLLPVREFLQKIYSHPKEVAACTEDIRLEEVMHSAVSIGVHRIWVKEKDTNKPIGVVSMSDMLDMLVGHMEPQELGDVE